MPGAYDVIFAVRVLVTAFAFLILYDLKTFFKGKKTILGLVEVIYWTIGGKRD